ncbi:acetyl-CoA C-acyltransferase [Halobacteriales archaeon QH_8_64_26]|jgi:acetyl-CoA acetyltransferase family protein|nr:MAG: acetyl-CoA C-acyltransferase [Halobacteriales archaeon QH_8_64_26]
MVDTTPVVVQALRTPQGKNGGVYEDVRPEDLTIPLIDEVLTETGLSGEAIDDFMLGCAQQRDEQDNNIARIVALLSDLGETVPGTSINRWCASSAQAMMSAANAIQVGQRDAILAGGVESMTRVPFPDAGADTIHPRIDEIYDQDRLRMGMTAETVAEEYDISRDAQDEFALRSHERAAEATDSGRFEDEIVPIDTPEGTVEEDEGIRRDTSLDQLGDLPTIFKDDGTVTPGNASQISDGASMTLVTSREFAEEHGLEELAEIGNHNVAGVDPREMGVGPIPAVEGLLDRANRSVEEYDLVDLNEAFASQCLYCQRELGVDDESYNVNGGAIAIGHPLGATGARIPVTLIHELRKRDDDRGIATECVGFGQGAAIEFSLP